MAKKAKKSGSKKPVLGPDVEQAMEDAAVERDARGLMPLAVARDIVASAREFVRGGIREIDGTHVTDADRLWAALLSLEDGDELVRAATRLAWRYHPRGKDNTAMTQRYGDAVLPWIASRVVDGVLVDIPWCMGPCLLALDARAAFDLVWNLRGHDDSSEMVAWEVQPPVELPADELARRADRLRDAWIAMHPETALAALAELAERSDTRAEQVLLRKARAAPRAFAAELAEHAGKARAAALATRLAFPTQLTEEAILDRLDAAATEGNWPLFNYAADGRLEYFAMRLVAARAVKGDEWAIVFQRLSGSYPEALRIEQFAYGSEVDDPFVDAADVEQIEWDGDGFHGGTVTGWADELVLDEGMLDEHDLRFGRVCEVGYHPYRTAVIRAYLTTYPDCWPPAKEALAAAGIEKTKPLVVSTAFHHAIGPNAREGVPEQPWEILPSASPVFRSLAAALATRDASRFAPGTSNLDWRLHAYQDDAVSPPWIAPRFAGDGGTGWLACAMREAAVRVDARKLMPLDDARAVLAKATAFERGVGARVGDHWVQGSDRLWAALLSLEDGGELARVALAWQLPVRGAADNTALAERYGAGALAWMRQFVVDGTLHDRPGCLRASLLAIGDGAALAFLLELAGFVADGAPGTPATQLAALVDAWLDRDPARIAPLVELAGTGQPRARELLRQRALLEPEATRAVAPAALLDAIGVPRTLSAAHVLARLDRAASGAAEEQTLWPRFFHNQYPGQSEYHALHLVGVRDKRSDGWGVVIERVTGYGNSGRVLQYRFGPSTAGHVEDADRDLRELLEIDDGEVRGERGAVPLPEDRDALAQLTEPADYWAQREARSGIAPIRAYLDAHPNALFTDAATLAAVFGLAAPEVVVDATAFAHVDGAEPPTGTDAKPWHILPSASATYRSLADAIAERDRSRFQPGEPNTHWRRHAVFSPDGDGDEDVG